MHPNSFSSIRFRFLILGIILGIPAYSQSNDSLKIAQTVETYVSTNDFSGTILVAKNGMPIYHQSFGYGYLPAKNAIVNDFHFSIASVTKLFTAIRVLQLVDVGKLSLDESIETYLPKFKIPQGSRITLHHLLMHNSGLPNEKDRVYRRPYSPEEIVHTSLKNKAKEDFGNFHYNNLDYILLGLVIEAVSGASWEEQIQTFILDKLGMQETGFLAYGSYPSRFAYTYSYRNTKKPVQDALFYIENFYAAGSMYSTSKDLLLLDQALYGQALLSEKMSDLLAKSYPENSYCGYSVWNYRYPFSDIKPLIMERRGGIMGANVVLVRMPEQSGSIIILSNDDRFNPDSFGDESNLRERLIRVLGG